MALRNIVKEDDPLVRMKSRPVTSFDDRLHTLLNDMFETMVKYDGCGIAAVQVGILKRAVLIWYEDKLLELINPVILESEGSQTDYEGCLSVDSKKNCKVNRPFKVKVSAVDRNGNPFEVVEEGWRARIICHEVDHLEGVLFIDRKADK